MKAAAEQDEEASVLHRIPRRHFHAARLALGLALMQIERGQGRIAADTLRAALMAADRVANRANEAAT